MTPPDKTQAAQQAYEKALRHELDKRGRDRDKLDKGRFIGHVQKGEERVERFRAEFGGVACEESSFRHSVST
jgi:hypothetical protein